MNKARVGMCFLAWAFGVERVTGIEPALSAWEPATDPAVLSWEIYGRW
ncbi:hypothetical protein Ssi03_32880 [Sphaerisporangium siamense]|nr:hypothetical protein Ssi03_32880 [Sphaerisporangium siamense]